MGEKPPIIGPLNANAPTKDQILQKSQMKEIRELGKKLIDAIHDFAIDKKGDVSFLVAVGACDYVIKMHKARMKALGEKQTESFIGLEALAVKEKLTYPEPYSEEQPPTDVEGIISDNLK